MLAGKYRDLERRVLHLTLVEQTRFGNLVEISSSELTLLDLASGSVQQEVTFAERDGRTTIDAYRLNFHVHFQARPPHHCHPPLTAHVMSQLYGMNEQEKFTFQMRLVDWSGSHLRATDATGSSDPFLKFYIRGSKGKRFRNWYAAL